LAYSPTMAGAPHILIVDDHREIRDLVARALGKEGFRVSAAADGRAMRKLLADSRIDLILLDLMLPGEDGLSLCRMLRAESRMPIIMLTAKGDEVDRVIGLEMGADDYLAKPFAFVELVARVRALGRRARPAAPPLLERAGVALDPGRREVRRDGQPVPLSRKEFALLEELLRADGTVVSAEQLLERAWDEHIDPFTNVLRVTVMTLRRKLGDPQVIETVPGVGYQIR
jgi:DNA-binding response OmpR family regulator